MSEEQNKERKFTAYPTRSFTCSDEVWDRVLEEKAKSEKTWTNFLDSLLKKSNEV